MAKNDAELVVPHELELVAEVLGVSYTDILEGFMADLVSIAGNHGLESRKLAKDWLMSSHLPFGKGEEVQRLLGLLESGHRMEQPREVRHELLRKHFLQIHK